MRRNKASARRRAPNSRTGTTAMDGRVRANSTVMKGLLGRQLASIADTLAKASRRRDAEMQRRATPMLPATPAIQTPFVPSRTDPSTISDTEHAGGSDSGNDDTFGIHHNEPSMQDLNQFDIDLSQANKIMDDTTPQASLSEGYISDIENDPKKIFAQFEKAETSSITYDETDPKKMLTHLDGIITAASGQEEDEAEKMLAELSHVGLRCRAQSDNNDEDDIASMLADFHRTPSVGQIAIHETAAEIDPKQLLQEFEIVDPFKDRETVFGYGGDDVGRMLAVLEEKTAFDDHDDPGRLTADIERKTLMITHKPAEDEDDDLKVLHDRLTNSLSPPFNRESHLDIVDMHVSSVANHARCESVFDKAVVSCAIALQLEVAGLRWEEAQGWTTYLFSGSLDGHNACHNKDKIVNQATQELDKIIQDVLHEEKRYLNTESKIRQLRRLIVSNIAADASEEDLKEFFYYSKVAVQEINVLPKQDTVRRTKVAHVDMLTREAAIRASYMRGSIFGLVLDFRLAVEKEN